MILGVVRTRLFQLSLHFTFSDCTSHALPRCTNPVYRYGGRDRGVCTPTISSSSSTSITSRIVRYYLASNITSSVPGTSVFLFGAADSEGRGVQSMAFPHEGKVEVACNVDLLPAHLRLPDWEVGRRGGGGGTGTGTENREQELERERGGGRGRGGRRQ
ncbi:hypothetical protein E2C01_012301 [Portunus trituberculatus]|uniref:Uncharacterized protein n=1 Tax=Portunus trituberculatus TaxID=210409 RepID=A0A5B7DDK8_PORTR|nr:hypothetical protein [Portunus trituberculatus]